MNKSSKHFRRELKEAAIALPIILVVILLSHFEKVFGCVIGGVFVLLGLLMTWQTLRMSRLGRVTQATVVKHDMDENCFFPVVEFRDCLGNCRQERTDSGRGVRSPAVGSHVLVRYDPKGILECQIISFGVRWAMPIALITLGTAICAVVLFLK